MEITQHWICDDSIGGRRGMGRGPAGDHGTEAVVAAGNIRAGGVHAVRSGLRCSAAGGEVAFAQRAERLAQPFLAGSMQS